MEYFLETIAHSLHKEFGNTLNRHCLVFPNRRAGLYFLKYLANTIEKPVWAPSILTINELFRSFSSMQIPGSEVLIFELYKVYRRIKKSPESFDDFYFWGDMLLNDFDDVDKYIVDASLLFRNIHDLKSIDQQFGGLTEAQIEIVKRFWINFDSGKPTNEKSGFIGIWSLLYDLYSGFRSSLRQQNLAYEGMIFRDFAENSGSLLPPDTRWDMLHFIGFNALNDCEKVIMTGFKRAGKARFYWDYDKSYIEEGNINSAGFFLRENLKVFGNDMPGDWDFNTMLSVPQTGVRRRVIETSSDVAQVKLISRLINELPGLHSGNAHHTAVVLADENLLIPVLTSLPDNAGDINITMGHPLKLTLVYTLVKNLMELQNAAISTDNDILFSYRNVLCILKHSLLAGLLTAEDNTIVEEITESNQVWVPAARFADSLYLSRVFRKPMEPVLLSAYFKEILTLVASDNSVSDVNQPNGQVQQNIRNEFIYRIILSVNRLDAVVNSPDIIFTTNTYIRILDRMLRIQSVPFSGEPLSGIQIMGILETRALDFKNLIILSVNDGVLPAVSSGSSFIPFSLREAFGIPSVNHQESIYAYHFYRLLQRAEDVTFIYNSNSEGLRSGEMSRFLIQMKYDKLLRPEFLDHSFEIKSHNTIGNIIERTESHIRLLQSHYLTSGNCRILSPSAINTWINCRMKFFYRYVNGLKEPETISADIDPAMMGSILHEVMRKLYHDYAGQVLTGEMLGHIIGNARFLQTIIMEGVSEKFRAGGQGLISGNELIVRDVLMAYLVRILNYDKTISPLTILKLEKAFSFKVTAVCDGNMIELETGGVADRIDIVNGVTRIVDYKTGTVSDTISSISELFSEDRKKDADGWLQTLLYCEAYLVSNPSAIVRPSVYKIKKLSGATLSDRLRVKTDSKTELIIDDYKSIREEFINGLNETLAKIFSKNEPFLMTTDLRGKCEYCPYRSLCNR
jgi:hypothetical protein